MGSIHASATTTEGAAFVFLGGVLEGDIDDDLKTDLVMPNQLTGANLASLNQATACGGVCLMNGTARGGNGAAGTLGTAQDGRDVE